MTIGEPRHAMPSFVGDVLAENLSGFAKYPNNNGTDDLLSAIAGWLDRRFGVSVSPATDIMALNGTREGLMNACIALCPEHKNGKQPVVLTPNPFYQVYAVAAGLCAGHAGNRFPAGLRRFACRNPGSHEYRLYLFAVKSAGGHCVACLSARSDCVGREA